MKRFFTSKKQKLAQVGLMLYNTEGDFISDYMSMAI